DAGRSERSSEVRSERGGERSERGPRSYGAGSMPRRDKIDPWFLKPYEPSSAPRRDTVQAVAGTQAKPKQKLAVLLGGLPKPQA
ncbi:MAG TPA: DEAD/DEAH box helicase, partial [Massilia sp.]|nr:DEAD/DEAH box helicase [Massilia sp.]